VFGCQKEEDKFVIWKHSVKWRRYAGINVNEEALLFEGFNKKKKRRRIETIYNCLKKFNIMKSIKEGRIYNIFTEHNQEFIIRKAIRKKNSNLNYVEEEEIIDPEKLFMNWRTRKKKPSDKLINVVMFIYRKIVEKKDKKVFKGKRKKRRRRERYLDEDCLRKIFNVSKNLKCSDSLKTEGVNSSSEEF
jgi:hypothetical protein